MISTFTYIAAFQAFEMNFDEILVKYLGEFGKYQKIQFILVCLPTIFTAMHSLSWTFTGATVPFRFKPTVKLSTTLKLIFFMSNLADASFLMKCSSKIRKIHHRFSATHITKIGLQRTIP